MTKPADKESYDCHACVGLLSAAVFSQKGGNWHVESEEKYLMDGASFGEKPGSQLIQFGRDKFGVLMHYCQLAQEYEAESIVLVASEGNAITPVLELTTSVDSDDETYSVEYRFVPRSNADYFDLATTKTTKSTKGDITSTEVFSLVRDKYVRSGVGQ